MSQTTHAPQSNAPSVAAAIQQFLDNVTLARSPNTAHTYRYAMQAFTAMLSMHALNAASLPLSELSEDTLAWFAAYLKHFSPATESLYLTAAARFFEFLAAERLADPNLPRVRLLIRQRSRRIGQRLPQFPKNDIALVTEYAIKLAMAPAKNESEKLRLLRDRAFLLTLADTGLRVHEACGLRRGDLDWNEGKALVIGKGDRQALVRFSRRALAALKDYLQVRAALDGTSGKPLASLPVFARHDKGTGAKVKPITTVTGRNIVAQRVAEALGSQASGTITPHSFRHYFVTTVLVGSGGNLKLAQELARHRNIAVTQRYAHLSDEELDQGYWDIFED